MMCVPGRSRCATRSASCPRACTWRSSTRPSGAAGEHARRAVALRGRRPTHCWWVPTTVCCGRPHSARRSRGGGGHRPLAAAPGAGVGDLPRTRHLRPRGRPRWPAARRSPRWATRWPPRAERSWICPAPSRRRRPARARADHRPLRQRDPGRHATSSWARPVCALGGVLRRGRCARGDAPAALRGTFADVAPGELLLYEDAQRMAALAVNRGSAAAGPRTRARRRAAAHGSLSARVSPDRRWAGRAGTLHQRDDSTNRAPASWRPAAHRTGHWSPPQSRPPAVAARAGPGRRPAGPGAADVAGAARCAGAAAADRRRGGVRRGRRRRAAEMAQRRRAGSRGR